MKTRTIGIALLAASSAAMTGVAAQSLLERTKRDEVVIVGDDDPAMARAFKRARAGLDEFIGMARNPPAHFRTVAVKVGVTDKKTTEYFWLFPFRHTETGFVGTLNNRPELVRSVKMGHRSPSRRMTSSTGCTSIQPQSGWSATLRHVRSSRRKSPRRRGISRRSWDWNVMPDNALQIPFATL